MVLWHSSSWFTLKPRLLPVNQRPKVTVRALCQGAKCIPDIWGVRLLSYAWTLSLLKKAAVKRGSAHTSHMHTDVGALPRITHYGEAIKAWTWNWLVRFRKLQSQGSEEGQKGSLNLNLMLGIEWDNLAGVTYNVWGPKLVLKSASVFFSQNLCNGLHVTRLLQDFYCMWVVLKGCQWNS